MNKKGQVTIFIIVAIIIVAGALLIFSFYPQIKTTLSGEEQNPPSFLQSCLEDKITEATSLLSSRGGYVSNPLNKTFKFTAEKAPIDISYLCYTSGYYIPCVNQEPMLIQHLKKEIKDYVATDVENCFNQLTESLTKQGYAVHSEYEGFDVELIENKVKIPIDAKITLTKSTGDVSDYNNLNVSFQSKFYDTAIVVQEIVSQQAEFCNFEYIGYMTLYPEWSINTFRASDSTIIYSVKNENSIDKFRFAIRGCAARPGL